MRDRSDSDELNWLSRRLTEGRIGRREFLGRSAALGLTSALATALAGKALRAAAPKKGGHMKLAMAHGATSDTLDPATLVNGYQWALSYAHRNALTEVLPGGGLGPSLAESWESSPDATTWRFKLRRGVTFHNGKSLTPEDVIASVNHHRAEDSKSFLKPIAGEIETIETDGDTVVFALTAGNADFPFSMASAGFSICPAAAEGGIDWQSGVGTGGFILEKYEPGIRADLKRNPDHWTDARAHADQVTFLTIHDATARSNALVTGEVHVIDQVDLKTAALLGRRDGIHVEETAGPAAFRVPHAHRHRAVRQQRRASCPQTCDRPGRPSAEDPARPWHARQRQPDWPVLSIF